MKRGTALELVRCEFEHNRHGLLDEQASVRLIPHGHTFKGVAVIKPPQ
ncbi:MAG TPA: hypothetical protein VJK29_20255 [Terriglobales bacterium]|nr:hypothetical protein [Terriglobales bacterium]